MYYINISLPPRFDWSYSPPPLLSHCLHHLARLLVSIHTKVIHILHHKTVICLTIYTLALAHYRHCN
jgi:hypothetical protein